VKRKIAPRGVMRFDKPGPESRTSTDTPPGSLRLLMSNSRSSSPTSRIASRWTIVETNSTVTTLDRPCRRAWRISLAALFGSDRSGLMPGAFVPSPFAFPNRFGGRFFVPFGVSLVPI
jgi:hypothetical protein